MRISDWSSDVCSSDLVQQEVALARSIDRMHLMADQGSDGVGRGDRNLTRVMHEFHRQRLDRGGERGREQQRLAPLDRKSVLSGKSVSVRVDLGGRRIIKKKKDSTRCTHINTKK